MTDPVITVKKAIPVELEPGTYYWCSCGRSSDKLFCDGSHAGTEFTPVEFTVTEKKTHHLCGCRHTDRKPYCDGKHKKL